MQHDSGFPPVEGKLCRVLILGSFPGQASLGAGFYYAHPRNAFWRIMEVVYGIPRDLAIPDRVERLTAAGVGLWDVVQSCHRPGSLDSAIHFPSVKVNDVPGFIARHPELRAIALNGGGAANLFRRKIQPLLDPNQGLQALPLPSTSPAYAGMSVERKIEIWRDTLLPWGRGACE